MKLLNPFIDRFQATFPPNRLMLILAGPIVAAAAWTSGVVGSNIPGVELPVGVVAGIIGAAVLIVITLIYKWFDQWQRGEPINIHADLEAAYDEIVNNHATIDGLVGAAAGIGTALAQLRDRVTEQTINEAELADELGTIEALLDQATTGAEVPDVEVASTEPAVDAPPTAAAAA